MFFCEYQYCLPPGKQMRETGSVKTRTSQRDRKHALTPEDIQNIDRVVQQEPDITIDENH